MSILDTTQLEKLWKLHDRYELEGLIDLAKKAPHNIRSLIWDRLDRQPVDDYVTEFEIRCDIFDRIRCMSRGEINTALFAVLMVAPVHVLKSRLAALEDDRGNQTEVDEMLSQWRIASLKGIQAFCKRRDDNRCCFTGMPDSHEAYIFPLHLSENTTMITDMLEIFWDADTVTQLVPLIRDRNVTESPQNLISMNGQLHTWFEGCKMALKPIEETEKGVVVQFHWLNNSEYEPDLDVSKDYIETLTSKTKTQKGPFWGHVLAHRASGLRLDTGQTFVLRSENPDHMPNFQLLKIDDETCSSVSEENNYPDVLRWREEVGCGIEIEADVEMETDEDGQPDDDSEGSS
ncbi:hypothetical protein M431DRAFT_494848 [Trichoderma harzianum CBS 226.95]|uniref:HNH nuclease domain-containing protein n=1 Tax=Trichoderma harzianum CBS 226.95 TaxID=983964 RepID=A0A2T4AC25_TRIHA|nr:hypothetical protein M431DRAFT_494848 [Trichoderma harzianum CBS 226.95]PTB54629.1 hypothetical protein M431DRAFT_494848 [Trichoderma harzianum CBS 226.95]